MKNIDQFAAKAKAALLCACLLSTSLTLNAQSAAGTDDDGFLVQIKSPASIVQDIVNDNDNCGWNGSTYGPSVTEELCGTLKWSGTGLDSLACNPLPAGSLDGKIAFIRRGTCSFSLKVYNAQQAGAKAVVIANHYTNAADGPCISYVPSGLIFGGMSGLDSADAVTIPSIYFQRQTAEEVVGALDAGETVEICFTFPRVLSPYAEYHYATPVSQIAPLANIGFNLINRESATIEDMVIKAEITEPNGNVTVLESPLPPLPPGTDTLVFFDPYTPPALVGEFNILYTNNRYTESRDTLRRKFVQTECIWAMDNLTLQLDGGADRNDLFAPTLKYQIGGLFSTGANEGIAETCTFGIANIDSIYDPLIPLGNLISVILYDADLDNDGLLDLNNDFEADLGANIVGLATYELSGTEKEENLIGVTLTDFITSDPGVNLLTNHPYYITVLYDGAENGSGRNCAFTNSAYVDYLAFVNQNNAGLPSTPMKIGSSFSFWGDRTVVTRLGLKDSECFIGTKAPGKLLDKSKYSVTPNPANDLLRLNLELENKNSAVNVSILGGFGNALRSQTLRDFQSGQINFDVRDIPSGTYLMWIRSTEGQTMTQVVVCH